MAEIVNLKSCAKEHLQVLASEIVTLIGHAKPPTKCRAPTTCPCWSTNNEDVNVALTVIRAVSDIICTLASSSLSL